MKYKKVIDVVADYDFDKEYIFDTDHIVESIIRADEILFEFDPRTQFMYNEYHIFDDGVTLINVDVCICKFSTTKSAVQAYTCNKPMDTLSQFEKQLICKHLPLIADVLES